MNLKQKYQKEVIPKMKDKFGYKNDLAVPKIEKITVNVGLTRSITEKDPTYIDLVKDTLTKITGQRPVETLSKKSIAGFKIRRGLTVGLMVTLRGRRMYDFLEKLINVVLPRTRDFRGIQLKAVDQFGNLSIGIKEHLVFPEIDPQKVTKIHGLQVTITTTAKNREKGIELLRLLGIPFQL